jgi:DNA uptake protein ComE-like DNA-binding protein
MRSLRLSVFSRAEMRLIGLCACLFLAGTGWRSVQARLPLSPLQVHGQVLDWESAASDSLESPGAKPISAPNAPKFQKKGTLIGVIDPNIASEAQLMSLPGVGPALCARIVAARSAHPFRKLEDLDRVKGIGPAKLEKLRPHLLF